MRHAALSIALGAAALAGLAACSQGDDRSTLVDRCLRDGDDREACECMAKMAEETLDPGVLAAMKLGAEGREEEADAAMAALPPAVQLSVVDFSVAAIDACGLTAPSGN